MRRAIGLERYLVLTCKTLASLVAACAIMIVGACSQPDSPLGTVLKNADPAPNFQLRDQFDRPVALDDYRGKVVALTFLYTYCPDICPAVTDQLKKAHGMLDADLDVAFLVVSVDPERDTVESAHEYSTKWGMLDKWAFLVGSEPELAPIWKSYYLDPVRDDDLHERAPANTPTAGVDALRRDIATAYTLSHVAPVYLIDAEGRMRVLMTPPLDPEAIAHDIRLLLR